MSGVPEDSFHVSYQAGWMLVIRLVTVTQPFLYVVNDQIWGFLVLDIQDQTRQICRTSPWWLPGHFNKGQVTITEHFRLCQSLLLKQL